MNTPTPSTSQFAELPALFGGRPVGSAYLIEGYVDTSGNAKTLHVRTLRLDSYADMKRKSLEILEKMEAPEVPAFPPALVAQARDALMASYRGVDTPTREFKDPYQEAPEGGYYTKEGEAAIYLLRLENIGPADKTISDPRIDLVRAKSALVKTLDLPAGRYMHSIKLALGKFEKVTAI